MSLKDIFYCPMRSTKSLLLAFVIVTLIATINRFELMHQAWKYFHVRQDTAEFGRVRNFGILPYPLNLKNASDLITMRRASQPIKISPINFNYMSVNFYSKSVENCESSGTYGILIMIKSAIGNRDDRMQVRRTWANQEYLSKFDLKIKYAFVLGKSLHDDVNYSIEKEIEDYNDLVIGDFIDTYRNLTYKTMLGIRWAVEFCPNFQFYLSFDDDSYLSVSNLVKFLRDPYNYPKNRIENEPNFGTVLKSSEHFFSGHTYRFSLAAPIRNQKSKYHLSRDEYPLNVFPAYVVGYFVAMSWETVTSFYYLSPFVKHLAMEDIYLGIMANKLGIPPFDITDLVSDGTILHRMTVRRKENMERLRNLIAIHHVEPVRKRTYIWRKLHFKESLDFSQESPPFSPRIY